MAVKLAFWPFWPFRVRIEPFQQELLDRRKLIAEEAERLAASPMDPEAWAGGRLQYEVERGAAHAYEGIRDRQEERRRSEVAEDVAELSDRASQVASSLVELEGLDRELIHALNGWREAYLELENDPTELSRYHRLRSPMAVLAKRSLAFLFVASEFIITGFIFEQALPLDVPLLGYVLALGVMVMLTAVPHYVAQGLKEGITDHHRWEAERQESDGGEPAVVLKRMRHREQQDDRGFKIASSIVGILLLLLALPLSIARATETLKGNHVVWFFLFLIIQLGISGYFFLREWLDHGAPSSTLHKLDLEKQRLEGERAGALEDYGEAVSGYLEVATPMFQTLLTSIADDRLILDSYLEAVHSARHTQALEQPELAPFITAAAVPELGAKHEGTTMSAAKSARSVTDRGWWLGAIARGAEETAKKLDAEEVVESDLLIDAMARDWLERYLLDLYGLRPYIPPRIVLSEARGDDPIPDGTPMTYREIFEAERRNLRQQAPRFGQGTPPGDSQS